MRDLGGPGHRSGDISRREDRTMDRTAPITVLVIDDDPDIRRVLRANLYVDPRFELVADRDSGETAASLCAEHQPQILVLDLMMPGVNGAQVLDQVKRTCSETKVAMFTAASVGMAASLTGYEADLYISKSESILEVMEMLVRLAEGAVPSPRPPEGPVIKLPL